MALVIWRGEAPPIAQVVNAEPANVEIGDIFRLEIAGRRVEVVAETTDIADLTAALAAAWNAATAPELVEVEAEDLATHVRLTAREPGRPFTVTAAAIDGGSFDTQSLTLTEVSPSRGPHHWDDPANWSGGAVPAEGDVVYLDDSESEIRYGLEQSAVVLAALRIGAGFTGRIGLARRNELGAANYAEYRPRYLAIGAAVVDLGRGPGAGSPQVLLDTGSSEAAAITVHTSGWGEGELPAFSWIGGHAASTLLVRGGRVGIAFEGGQEAELAELKQAGGEVRCGAGTTLGDVELAAGELQLESGVGALRQTGGTLRFLGGGIESLALSGGTLEYRSAGDIDAALLDGAAALLEFSADLQDRTVLACTLLDAVVLAPHETATCTTGIQPGREISATRRAR